MFRDLTYSKTEARYLDKNGGTVSPQSVAKANRGTADERGEKMGSLARRAQSGDLSAESWRKNQRKEVDAAIYYGGATGAGGKDALSNGDYKRMAAQRREAYARIDAKYLKILSDPDYLQSEAFVSESASYSNEGVVAHEIAREVAETEAGYQFEYNEEDEGAEHCKPKNGKESCGQQTAKGIVKIGGLVRWGATACNNRCRCTRHRFKTKEAAEIALGLVEQKEVSPLFYGHGAYTQ